MSSEMVRKCDGCGAELTDHISLHFRTSTVVKNVDCCVKTKCAEQVLRGLITDGTAKKRAARKKKRGP